MRMASAHAYTFACIIRRIGNVHVRTSALLDLALVKMNNSNLLNNAKWIVQ